MLAGTIVAAMVLTRAKERDAHSCDDAFEAVLEERLR